MNRNTNSFFRRMLGDENGAVAILVAVGIFAFIGFGALSVDVGYLFYAQRVLQASADAAAMAGSRDIGVGGTPNNTATLYSAVAGNKNANANLTVTMAAGYPQLKCFNNIGSTCTTNQTPATSANGIKVQELATVPLFFGRIFGIPSVQLSASSVALAAGGVPHPLNVMFVIDTTGSMGTYDSACLASRITCVQNGVKLLLGQLWPCASNLASCGAVVAGTTNVVNPVDEVGLMQFPGVESVPANYDCISPPPSTTLKTAKYSGIKGVTNATTSSGNTTLHFAATPAFNTGNVPGNVALVSEAGTPTNQNTPSGKVLHFQNLGSATAVSLNAPVLDLTNPGAIPTNTIVSSATATTVTMSKNVTGGGVQSGDQITFGSITPGTYIILQGVTATTAVMSAGAANAVPLGDEIHVSPPVYPLVPLSSDYRTSDTSPLNAMNSNLVKCVNALRAAGGTYYADAINVAQNILTANARPGATNIIVMLTDGGSNADNSNAPDNMLAANIAYQCSQGVTAAQNAAKAGTWVYSIAYAATTQAPGDCVYDIAPYSTCYTISKMANIPGTNPNTYVNDPTKFYSDNSAGCQSTANPNITSLNQVFQSIGYSLTTSRLLPNACFGASPPNWCS
jgi:Flp pilus assembly protein TadG